MSGKSAEPQAGTTIRHLGSPAAADSIIVRRRIESANEYTYLAGGRYFCRSQEPSIKPDVVWFGTGAAATLAITARNREVGMIWISLFGIAMAAAIGLSIAAMLVQGESVRG
jgi:hypothetical protein